MAGNINISDYEKIVFVNNINENDDNQKTLLTDNKYNFAVFVSDNTNVPEGWPNDWKNFDGQPAVKTIWYKGQRLNRFIGIDPNNSTFTINDYTFKLIFDYENGLLGVSDINKLEGIRVYAITYTDERGVQRTYSLEDNSLSNLSYISSIDNKFILYLDFIAERQDETNIQRITKSININCASNNSNIAQDTSATNNEEILYEGNKIIARRSYTFKINKDTYISRNRYNENKAYTIISTYDSEKTADINFMLSLNPIDFTITNGTNLILSRANTTNSKTYNDLTAPLFDIFDVVIDPHGGEAFTYPISHDDRKLYLKIVSSNLNAASIKYNGIENNQKIYIPVDYTNNFELKINNVDPNVEEVSEISVSLTYDNTENNNPDIILKKFNIITTNGQEQQIIGIIESATQQIRANTDVIWYSQNPQIVINPSEGTFTTYSISPNIQNPIGSYVITSDKSSITLGETVTLTIKWTGNSVDYTSTITARKTNWLTWSGVVTLRKSAEQPSSVLLSNGSNVSLNSSGIGTLTYTPTEEGTVIIGTMDTVHTNSTCRINVGAAPVHIRIDNIGNNQLKAMNDDTNEAISVNWSSANSNISINPSSGNITTYSLASSVIAPKGTFTITSNKSSITYGDKVILTVQWTAGRETYTSRITANYESRAAAGYDVSLVKTTTTPTSVTLSNGQTVQLTNGTGSVEYTPSTSGSLTIRTTANTNENTNGSCTITVTEPVVTTDYYIYIGLQRPDASTNPESDLASNNTPLYSGYGAAGWHNIGQDTSIYNSTNPAYNGGSLTVILDIDFNDVTCYVAIPVGMGIYDAFGGTGGWSLDQENITIKGRQYNVYVTELEGEFGEIIY